MLIHLGAQSNLYAALAWTLVNLLLHPDVLARVRAGDDDLLERAAYESIRLAQRSLTLRQVLQPLDFDDGARSYRLAPGVLIATMLSVTNTSAAPGLERFDPDHYEGPPAREGDRRCPRASSSAPSATAATPARRSASRSRRSASRCAACSIATS